MKKVIIIGAILISVMVSCKKEEIKTETTTATTDTIAAAEEPIVTECYQGIIKNDTFDLAIETKGRVTTGKLNYNFFEKDKNHGELIGVMKGDTLFANYTFMSEGKTSEREVVFLKKGNIYIEGYGEVTDGSNGKVTFKDKKKLFFDSKTVLTKTDCK